jgi:hypothetical protein
MTIHPITLSQFANKRFLRTKHYRFAAKEAVAALVAQEFPKAALSLPIGFVAAGEGFAPVAVLGLQSGKNLFVSQDGRWLGGYIPAAFRGFPFMLARADDERQVLCIHDEHGSISETEGEFFFGEDEQPTQPVKDILAFLNQVASDRVNTLKIIAVMQKHKLIAPWPIKIHNADQQEQSINGLFRVDETVLNKLPDEALLEIYHSGAMPLIYSQLLSMQHLPKLGKLAQAHFEVEQIAALPKTQTGDLDISFLADDTTISFDNL